MAEEHRKDKSDRHGRRWRPTLRPNRALYERAKVLLEGIGWKMSPHYEEYLRWVVHDTDELPPRPPRPDHRDTEQ